MREIEKQSRETENERERESQRERESERERESYLKREGDSDGLKRRTKERIGVIQIVRNKEREKRVKLMGDFGNRSCFVVGSGSECFSVSFPSDESLFTK